MKILCMVLIFLSVGAISGAQEQLPSVQIGLVTVRLGMPKSELQAQLPGLLAATANGSISKVFKVYRLGTHDEHIWIIGADKEHADGTIEFTDDGVVGFASREWLVRGSDAVQVLLGAIDSFTQQGLSACVISHDADHNPSWPNEGATIQCGAKRLYVFRTKFGVSKELPSGYDEGISEQIGRL